MAYDLQTIALTCLKTSKVLKTCKKYSTDNNGKNMSKRNEVNNVINNAKTESSNDIYITQLVRITF